MAKVIKGLKTGKHRKSTFDPEKDGILHHPTAGGPASTMDLHRVEDLLETPTRQLRDSIVELNLLKLGGAEAEEPEIQALRSHPESIKPFLRLARAFMTRDESELPSFRSLTANSFLLPDAVFDAVAPSLIKTLQHYHQVSTPELSILTSHPKALKPFLNLKSVFYLHPKHRFSEMLEPAAQLPDTLLNVMSADMFRRLRKYPDDIISRRARERLEAHEGQFGPYLRLRQKLGLTAQMPLLPEVAAKVVDGVDEKKFPEQSQAVLTLLAGCHKKQVGDRTLAFLEKYPPERLRSYLVAQTKPV